LRALIGREAPILYGAGLDYQLGVSAPGGFAYELDLYPIGFGFMLGHTASLGVRAGVGISGVTGRLPVTAQFPVEALLEFDLHRRVRVAAWGRVSWVTTDDRSGGSDTASFADELSAGLALRWGKRYYENRSSMSAGNGFYVAALVTEQLGSRVLGVAFGHSLNAAGGRL
jgi:hypothetical protein